jgi:hypothetical protein
VLTVVFEGRMICCILSLSLHLAAVQLRPAQCKLLLVLRWPEGTSAALARMPHLAASPLQQPKSSFTGIDVTTAVSSATGLAWRHPYAIGPRTIISTRLRHLLLAHKRVYAPAASHLGTPSRVWERRYPQVRRANVPRPCCARV